MEDSMDEMEINSEELTTTANVGGSGKRKDFGSQEDLTPRKRPRTSFWPSKRFQDDQKAEGAGDSIKLQDLKAGCRSSPVEVRVISKEVRASFLKMVVMDSSGERIVKAFKGCIAQFQHIMENKIYQLGGFNVQAGYKGSPDEIVLQSTSTMNLIERENFPKIVFDFKPLQNLFDLPDNSNVDVVGIITSVEPVSETSNGKKKRELVITDSSKTEISVFFWETHVELCDNLKELSPIVLRFAMKKTFGDEAVLWYSWKTQILMNPSHPTVDELVNWFHEEAVSENIQI